MTDQRIGKINSRWTRRIARSHMVTGFLHGESGTKSHMKEYRILGKMRSQKRTQGIRGSYRYRAVRLKFLYWHLFFRPQATLYWQNPRKPLDLRSWLAQNPSENAYDDGLEQLDRRLCYISIISLLPDSPDHATTKSRPLFSLPPPLRRLSTNGDSDSI